ncbi:MAG TPA: formate dehydrogenase accessory sulfurtransferase FdhD [Myxococcales bacterium]|nr:formate dehydrogenase accessory sulfurtransferase FdhD [Myxococcales bacterium]
MAAKVHRAASAEPQPRSTVLVQRMSWRDGRTATDEDEVAAEEPLELRLNGRAISVTMRTPGDDEALALGFLWGEGIVLDQAEVIGTEQAAEHVVDVRVTAAVLERGGWQRNFYTASSCGVCGKASLSMIRAPGGSVTPSAPIDIGALPGLAERLGARQAIFARTGGVHAAAWIEPQALGVRDLAEDVGRHNAVDKIVGRAFSSGRVPLSGQLLAVSGRAGFELVQKAIAGGFAALAAVGAPSSLAIALAEERGLGLIGFLRERGFNIYARPERFFWQGRSK